MEIEIQKHVNPLFDSDTILILLGGVLIGHLSVEHKKDRYFKNKCKLTFNKKCCYLHSFNFIETCQNKGYGHKVLQYIKKEYLITCFVLYVQKEDARAIHLYKSEGFKLHSGEYYDTMIFMP